MRRLTIFVLLAILLAAPLHAAITFDFKGEKSGDPPLKFSGTGFADGTSSRYDFLQGNHPLFRANTSVLSYDSKILTVVDHAKGTYFKRATRQMAGIITTYSAPYQVGADDFKINIETLDRESVLGAYRPVKHHLTFSYRIRMNIEGEEAFARVECDAELWLDPKYRLPAFPWGHQFALKTGIPEFDDQIAKKLISLGFPFRQIVTVTRTIEGSDAVSETLRVDVTRFGDVPFTKAGFDAPAGYRYAEPRFSVPTIRDMPVETASVPPPPPVAPAAATATATKQPPLPLETLDPKTAPPLLVESMEVRVVNVDAVVTDKKGSHVPGLTKDNFEIREGGSLREITNFLEVSSASGSLAPQDATAPATTTAHESAPSAERRSRKFVLFFDHDTLEYQNRGRVVDSMKKFVSTVMRPGDEAMIAVFEHGLKVELQFTGDAGTIEAKLDQMKDRMSSGQIRAQNLVAAKRSLVQLVLDYQMLSTEDRVSRPPYDEGLALARTYAEKVLHDTNQTIGAIQALMGALQAIPGRKVFVYATEALPARAGDDIFAYFDGIKDTFEGGSSRSPLSESISYDVMPKIQALADAANAAGFTMYPIQAKALSGSFAGADMEGGSQYNFNTADRAADDAGRMADIDAFQTLAKQTGGMAVLGANNFDLAFKNVTDDLEQYYSLGYRPVGERSTKPKAISVVVKKPSLVVRTKTSYFERPLEAEVEEIVAANLFYNIDRNDLGVKISTTPLPPGDDGRPKLKLRIDIPTQTLALLPQGTDLAGSFTVFVGFVKGDGSVSKIARESRQFKFPASTLPKRKYVSMELEVTADAGTNRISVGVLDDASKATGFASTFIESPKALDTTAAATTPAKP